MIFFLQNCAVLQDIVFRAESLDTARTLLTLISLILQTSSRFLSSFFRSMFVISLGVLFSNLVPFCFIQGRKFDS